MSETIGPITIVGTADEIASVRPFVMKAVPILGNRIKPVTVVFRPADRMPPRGDGGPSFGRSKLAARKILLLDEIEDYPVAKDLGHELCHFLDEDWLTKAQRVDLMAFMEPKPKGWGDDRIGKYVSLPSECFAAWGSAAIFGFNKPAWARFYRVRRIPQAAWEHVAEIALADRGPAEPEAPEPGPPPDPLQLRIDELETALRSAGAAVASASTEVAKIVEGVHTEGDGNA